MATSCGESLPVFTTDKKLGFLDKNEITSKEDKINIFVILPELLNPKYKIAGYFRDSRDIIINNCDLKVSDFKESKKNNRVFNGAITFVGAEYPTKLQKLYLQLEFDGVITSPIISNEEILIKPLISQTDSKN